jgi:hypothetical protein
MKRRKNPELFTPTNLLIAAGVGVGIWLIVRELRKRGILGSNDYAVTPVSKPKSQPSGPTFWQKAKSVTYMPIRVTQDYGSPAPAPSQAAPTPTPVTLPTPTPTPVSTPTLQRATVKPQYATYEPGQFDITGQPYQPAPQPFAVVNIQQGLVTQKPYTIRGEQPKASEVIDAASEDIDTLYEEAKDGLKAIDKQRDELLKRAEVTASKYLTSIRYGEGHGSRETEQRKLELSQVGNAINALHEKRAGYIDRVNKSADEKIGEASASVKSLTGGPADDARLELEARKKKGLESLPKEKVWKPLKKVESEYAGKNYYERFKEAEKMFRQVNPNDALVYDMLITTPAAWDAKVKQFAKERGFFAQF